MVETQSSEANFLCAAQNSQIIQPAKIKEYLFKNLRVFSGLGDFSLIFLQSGRFYFFARWLFFFAIPPIPLFGGKNPKEKICQTPKRN